MRAVAPGRGWVMLLSSASHEQQQEKKASQLFAQRALQERRLKPPDQIIACPRCQSLNTKFCYYNNYSLTQPRHFCKNCRRYWTAGGTLRNVPVGGGCRKNKRAKQRSADVQSSTGTVSVESDSSAAVGLQSQSFASSSAGFFENEEAAAFARSQQSIRAEPSGVSQSGDAGLGFSNHSTQAYTAQASNIRQHSQPFDSGIMSLGFFGSARPEAGLSLHSHHHLHSGDLSAMFETPTFNRAGALAALSEGLHSYNHVEAGGGDPAPPPYTGLDVWRGQHQSKHGPVWAEETMTLDINRQQSKGKSTLCLSPSTGLDDEAARPAVAWQASVPQESLPQYDTAPADANFWSNSGWPPLDLQSMPGAAGGGGGQLL